ncbi:hypothetical protein K438DRAFT_2051444 [Mycena galopus ATCC 62051]|nr:hypothetical protein K438DRAFT_2051444 [Mycena galopus ATCC 62051]
MACVITGSIGCTHDFNNFTFPAVKFFTGLLGGSAIFNIIWMAQNEQNGFIKLLRFVLLLQRYPPSSPSLLLFAKGAVSLLDSVSAAVISAESPHAQKLWWENGGYQNLDEERPVQFSRSPAAAPSPMQFRTRLRRRPQQHRQGDHVLQQHNSFMHNIHGLEFLAETTSLRPTRKSNLSTMYSRVIRI